MTTPSHPADHHEDQWADGLFNPEDLDAIHLAAEDACLVDDNGPDEPPVVDPIAAYADGYQQGVDPGWYSENHVGTEWFELGYIDGIDRRLGDAPSQDEIRHRLVDWGIELQDV